MQRTIGLDIGGANIKCATSDGVAIRHHFELWKFPEKLAAALRQIVTMIDTVGVNSNSIAVTMTGELADCFSNKQEGVKHIVESVETAFEDFSICYFQVGGGFVCAADAINSWQRTSAANWFALARYTASEFEIESGFLFDIGSTTTDLIPIVNHDVATHSISDLDRLKQGELLYTGVSRTPVCAVTSFVNLTNSDDGSMKVPFAAEWFATMADVYVLLEKLAEDPLEVATADGKCLDKNASRARLARCLCSDRNEISDDQILDVAKQIKEAQVNHLTVLVETALSNFAGIQPVNGRLTVVISGQGEFIAAEVLSGFSHCVDVISLRDRLGIQVSECAPAFAVANLLEEPMPTRCPKRQV